MYVYCFILYYIIRGVKKCEHNVKTTAELCIDKPSSAYYNRMEAKDRRGGRPAYHKGVWILMERKNNGVGIFIGVLLAIAAIGVTLALLIRTEERLLRLVGKAEKALSIKGKKEEPFTVEL